MPSGPPPMLSITGELASAPNRSGRMRHLGGSMTPFWWPNGRWHGNARPTSQSSSTGSCEPTTCCSERSWGMRGGVTAIQCWGARSSSLAISRIWVASAGMAARGARRLRHAGAAPTSPKPSAPPGLPSAACWSVAHWTCTSPWSKRPAAETTSSGAALRSVAQPSGSRYQADRSIAGCCTPERQLPSTGLRAGSSPYGSRAREPLIPAAAVVPPSVPASLVLTTPSVSAKLPPGRSITGSAETSDGMPFGVKPSAVAEPSASPTDTPIGVSSPALGSSSTITSSASPQVLPVSACRLDRPTDHAGYWSIIASVSDSTSKNTSSQATTASGEPTAFDHQPDRTGRFSARPEKWNQAATTSVTTVSPSSIVVNPKCHSGNWFDHGTPKLDTYHQPLTLANDSAVTNSTRAANTARLRLDRSTCAVTATAASAPSEPARPANTPKWCVHLVGVNIIARNEMIVMPMMRRLGPPAVPGMWPRRSIIATETASATSSASTANRRAIEPSGLAMNSRS